MLNCHKHRAFAMRGRTKEDNRRRDGWNPGNKDGKRTERKEESRAMVTVDGECVDWTTHSEDDENFAFMASNSSGSNTQVCSNECKESYANLKRLYDAQREQLSDASVEIKAYTQGLKKVEAQLVAHQQGQLWYEQKIKFMKIDLDDKTDVLTYHKTLLAKAQKEKDDLEVIVDKWNHSSKNLGKIINDHMPASDKFGLGYGDYRYSGNLSYENEISQSVFMCNKSDSENRPLHTRLVKPSEMQAVPPPMTGNYLPSGPDIEIDDSQYTYGPRKSQPSEPESQTTELDTCDSNTSTEPSELVSEPVVNESPIEVQPRVWSDAPIIEEYESDSDDEHDNPHRNLQNKGIIDSGCSRHMTGNKAYLADYQDINGGPVAFGGSKGYITGKGKIKTGKLDFEDVSFVKELQPFNLFSVSQMCDKKNKVLFTDTECLVLSPDFKLPDENQILLKVPRQNNMYSFNLENIVPLGGLACLIAKATTDESNLWHRRLGHVNFKNLNRLVKGNLVRGLPTKLFQNDHTCVACQKGKQHKASCKAKLVSSISNTLQLLHMDLFGPTSVRSINHKTYCLVITDDFSRFSWTFFLRTKDETSAILKDFIRQIENQLNQKVKIIRCDNGTEFKNKEVIEFCGLKGIKREYSNARTPQQNGVAERKNRTLIEAARTMLADSFLPNTFWAEAVSTACYVLNRVLVTKPHNKTPYELLTGKTPIISYIRPFGCHVTILNTIDHLGKFAGKSDEGFLVGYSLQSKVFRVYNLETKRVEENLHITFLENKPNVAGKGPTWLFNLDYLTNSMNYHPVISENQGNINAGQHEANHNTGTEDIIDAGDFEKEDESAQDYFVLPIWSSYSSTITLDLKTDEKKEYAQETENLVIQAGAAKASSTNIFSTVSTPAKASKDDNEIPPLEDIHEDATDGIFTHSSYDDEGAVADLTNLETVVNVSPIPTSRIKPSHPSTLILGYSNIKSTNTSNVNKILKLMLYPKSPEKVYKVVKALYGLHQAPRAWYLKGKPKLGLWYPRESSFDLESYSDSDYAGANLDRKSTTGGCQFLAEDSATLVKGRQYEVFGSSVDERGKTHHGKSNLFQETPKPLCSTFLPTDIKHCLNVGYTFVNFTTSEAVWKSHVCITRKSWPLFKSKKIAQVVRAWIQSKNSLVKHFEDMRLCRPSKEYLLVWFDPPRDESMSCLTTKGMHTIGAVCARRFRESLRRVTDGAEAFLILTLFILCLDKVSTDHAKLVPLGKVCTAKETLEKNTAKGTKCKLEPLISLTDDLSLLSNMAALESCPKHNMIAYLEKTEGNVEFHEVIDFLRRSYIYHALTVSPVVSTTFVEQFWTSAKSKTINNVRHITAKVVGKVVSISDGIDSLPNQAIFDAIQLMGYEGDLTVLTFNKALFSPQWRNEGWDMTLKNVSMSLYLFVQRFPRKSFSKKHRVHKESVSKQGRKKAKGESSVQRDPLFDVMPEDKIDHMETENAQSEGRTREKGRRIDEELARKVQEEWEAEEERNIIAEEKATNEALIKNFDDIKARIEADRILAEKLQEQEREQFTIEERANMWGTLKHSELKSKKFEDIQAMYEKIKRSDEDFIAIGSVEDDRLIKKMNKKDSSKGEEIQAGGGGFDESKRSEEINMNVVTRSNGQKRSFSTLIRVLSVFDREDLDAVYKLVMDIYQDKIPKGFDKVLWGDLMLCSIQINKMKFWNSQALNGKKLKYPLKKEILMQMLKLKLESEEDSTMALELIRFIKKSWLVQDQTVLGKDYSNLLIADSLLKTIWFINAPCYDNEALASPNTNELSIPEQTATGKGTSNPLMAKRHEENSNLIKEIRASTDVAIRNQGASIKALEI
ncbi:putative ribonuclease H-like domain-containing protein [Tanacetum coccineum]